MNSELLNKHSDLKKDLKSLPYPLCALNSEILNQPPIIRCVIQEL